ncbi:DUF3800 domain-containing protein [Algoriphagus pacificus]|jgi:hypothetical protein|uniref:DUF3800 domain-containing protein n=1 Tax=Algoriphagus pacificus TaxID=2811234 RepID=A0ABS3CJY8_9BACT|nr:DUF3800 domain-containing protein [Algoriphagus pacificus]MBN7816854.1 DUF3800 domain-containing protein [Algoriphagus pacificus]
MLRLEYNIYCDESCHLPNDNSKVMVLGATWCPTAKRREIFTRIREIKVKHGFKPDFEIKWNKVSPAGVAFYMEIINYFFDDDDIHFRALVVPNKQDLNHEAFNQDHDTFYYKMYFDLLKVILSPDCAYNIYIDIKDTKSQEKVEHLQNVLRNNHYDYHKQIVQKIQQVHSHEVELLQITDMLTGAISYLHRGLSSNAGKMALIDRIKKRSGYSLTQSTLYKENKFNLFIWKPRAV